MKLLTRFQKRPGSAESPARVVSSTEMKYSEIARNAEEHMGQKLSPADTQMVLEYAKLKNRLIGNNESELPALFLNELQDVLLQKAINDLRKGNGYD